MAIKTFKPTTPSRRHMTVSAFEGIDKKAKPERSLVESQKKHAGRNSYGRITVRHHGGGNKQKYRIIDFKRLSEIAKSVGAYLMVDMAHIAGLVAAGVHPSPVPYADITTTTTHKTLRGPRGGLILTNDEELAKKINKAVFPGTQGGPLMHVIAAKAVCFGEALKPEFQTYGKTVVANASALADGLMQRGFRLVSGGTDNHLMLVDLRPFGDLTGKEFERRLDEVFITVNKNAIPNDPQKPFVTSGIRVGTPAVTTRGLQPADMEIIAQAMYLAASDFENKAEEVRESVCELCKKYPLYE